MRLRSKYLVDALLGRPLVGVLNALAFPLGKLLHRDHALETTRSIVVCKLMGLGSIVQITPLLAALRRAYPQARIVFLTRSANRAFCERIAVIDEVLAIDDDAPLALLRTTLGALRRLWAIRVDMFLNLEVYSNFGALLTITSCARNRIGYYTAPRDQRAWGVYTHMVYFNRAAPIDEVYLQAARSIGIDDLSNRLLAPAVPAAERAQALRRLRDCGVATGPRLVVNPNASELSAERRWPPAAFARTIEAVLAQRPELQAILVGGPGEEAVSAEVAERVGATVRDRVLDLGGRLSLVELIVLLDEAAVFLTNDSGPMHLAFSLETPTVGLFGPVSPEHYGGTAAPSRVLFYQRLYCSPCVHHFLEAPCGGDNRCMQLIPVESVVAAVEDLLSGRHARSPNEALTYRADDVVFGTRSRDGLSRRPD